MVEESLSSAMCSAGSISGSSGQLRSAADNPGIFMAHNIPLEYERLLSSLVLFLSLSLPRSPSLLSRLCLSGLNTVFDVAATLVKL